MKTMKWMMVALLVSSVGCGSLTKDKPKDDVFDNVTFELRNGGKSSIWIGVEFPVKLFVGDEEYVPLESCACRECPEFADAVAEPARTEIRPGEQARYTWNGAVLGDDCSDLRDLEGQELVAEFCWGKNIAGPDEFIGGVTDIECSRQSFVLGEQGLVGVDVDSTVEYQPEDLLPIVVENQTGSPIFVQVADNCGDSTFFTVSFGSEELGTRSVCGLCDCSEGEGCFVGCAAACQAPAVERLAAGESFAASIARTYSKTYDEGTHQCAQQQLVPEGPLVATICYGYGVSEDFGGPVESETFGTVTGVACEDVEFEITDDEVRLTVITLATL